MNGWDTQLPDVSDSFDHDYNQNHQTHADVLPDTNHHHLDINQFSHYNGHQNDIFHHHDPLKYCHKHQFKPLHIQTGMDDVHFVKPHPVDSYVRKDGTVVEGYYRDGDGDTTINRNVEQGGGYFSR